MKRDMDLIRELLLELEEKNGIPMDANDPKREYHKWLLLEAGLADGNENLIGNKLKLVNLHNLTWDGHNFLDDIRDDGIWQKTKNAVGKVGSASLPIIHQVAAGFVKEMLGLGPSGGGG